MDVNVQPFKEPRGFIRLLQWLFAICAFAITVDYSGSYGFYIRCGNTNGTASRVLAVAEYPFNMEQTIDIKLPCGTPKIEFVGNAKSESVFFVFTGVISFLYATGMIVVHLIADQTYLNNKRAPLVDFFLTIVVAVFWIAGSGAWAHGVSSISGAMQTKDCPKGYDCVDYFYASTSKLLISALFGFINFVLWSGNIWFLYKETATILNGMTGAPPPATSPQEQRSGMH